MIFFLYFFLLLPSLPHLARGDAPSPRSPAELLQIHPTRPEHTATFDELLAMAELASKNRQNAFELLRDISLHMARNKNTLRVLGDDLRRISETFDLGNATVKAILPLENLVEIHLGLIAGTPAIQVVLDQRGISTKLKFMGLIDVTLRFEQTYGIDFVTVNRLDCIHGVKAEQLGLSTRVLAVDLLSNTRVRVRITGGPPPTLSVSPLRKKPL